MARQSTTPAAYSRTIRPDTCVTMTSGRAGVVNPAGFIPLLAGDSCSGRVGFDLELAQMPKALLNGSWANFQAWFVPKSAHPQFPGRDELNHARTGDKIKSLGAVDRDPPPFFTELSGSALTTAAASDFFKVLGLHIPAGQEINTDLIDAFNVIYNFRLAAHSSRLTRRQYASENLTAALALPAAFWPSARFARVVPDYERSLIVGSLDLDIVAGRLPVSGIGMMDTEMTNATLGTRSVRETGGQVRSGVYNSQAAQHPNPAIKFTSNTPGTAFPEIFAEMGGQTIGITLQDLDKARTTQAFARLRTAYAGNDATGFDNDDTIVALLMQGIQVAPDDFKRPWLLDQKRVPIGYSERFASDGASLDKSVSVGRASAQLSVNVPLQDVSGVIIFTVEVLPERVDERMGDYWLQATTVNQLPNALRDVQRTEPVDHVHNWRIDAKHSNPAAIYGFEPMNDVWRRDFTRLGGAFYQPTPGAGFTENRANIWQAELVNPVFASSHYLAPQPFPHDVFSDEEGSAFELVVRHAVTISGLTQIGDVLAENNDDYEAVAQAGL